MRGASTTPVVSQTRGQPDRHRPLSQISKAKVSFLRPAGSSLIVSPKVAGKPAFSDPGTRRDTRARSSTTRRLGPRYDRAVRSRSRLSTLAALTFVLGLGADAAPPEVRDFGVGVTLKTPTSLAAVVSNPEGHVDRALLLSGRLTDLCTKKGCWTVLADGEHSVRVRFQDYGFFLPQDALGSRALVEGRAELRTLSEREARHYAEESRDGDPDAIDGPQRELAFVATGVRLLPPGTPP